jgi:hypothetical protein
MASQPDITHPLWNPIRGPQAKTEMNLMEYVDFSNTGDEMYVCGKHQFFSVSNVCSIGILEGFMTCKNSLISAACEMLQ